MPRAYENLANKEINGLLVKEIVENSGGAGRHKKWLCECLKCHKEIICQSNHIKNRNNPFCDACSKETFEDLTGQKFYRLTVDHMIKTDKWKRTMCSCTCECGSTNVIVQANHLKFGDTKSCGCLKSYPEEQIAFLLTKNNIKFEREKKFEDLKYKNPLRYDFYLPELNLVIEYNGEQHYKAIEYYGGEENLRVSQLRDEIKKQYCIDNNISYLTIRFDENIENVLIANNIIMKR